MFDIAWDVIGWWGGVVGGVFFLLSLAEKAKTPAHRNKR